MFVLLGIDFSVILAVSEVSKKLFDLLIAVGIELDVLGGMEGGHAGEWSRRRLKRETAVAAVKRSEEYLEVQLQCATGTLANTDRVAAVGHY